MNKLQKIIAIIFNLEQNNNSNINKCYEEPTPINYNETNYTLDKETRNKLKKLILHLATLKKKITFNIRNGYIEIYFDEYQLKQNCNNTHNNGTMAFSNNTISNRSFNIITNEKFISINNSTYKNDGLHEELVELLQDKLSKIENIITNENIEDMIDISNYRRNMNLDELLNDIKEENLEKEDL